ncbi:protein FAM156A/FAM156B-like [Grammomys surdaster]|uniref:protein FAM156A/FAM156B-like n=1 Tax=Grammomys surdaster TaxID=491861 RepID=UPI0010A058AF|nr:protein FAM156A/FAM156B-like [Grammomys surdaster]
MDEEQHQESSKSPQKKLKTVEFKKKKHVRFLLPRKADKKKKSSSPQDPDEAMFRCECHPCQKCVGNTSGVSAGTGTEAISQSSSWEMLTLDLSNLTLNPHTTQPHLVQDTIPKRENKTQWQRKNKRMF